MGRGEHEKRKKEREREREREKERKREKEREGESKNQTGVSLLNSAVIFCFKSSVLLIRFNSMTRKEERKVRKEDNGATASCSHSTDGHMVKCHTVDQYKTVYFSFDLINNKKTMAYGTVSGNS